MSIRVPKGFQLAGVHCGIKQASETEDLVASAVSQNGAIPSHEPVQTAHAPDQLRTGPVIEVVGIAQQDLAVHILHLCRRHTFNRGLRAYRHEDRRLDRPVRGVQPPPPCMAGGIRSQQFKFPDSRHSIRVRG